MMKKIISCELLQVYSGRNGYFSCKKSWINQMLLV